MSYKFNPFLGNLDQVRSISYFTSNYLKLDCSNDPLTGNLDMTKTSPSLYLNDSATGYTSYVQCTSSSTIIGITDNDINTATMTISAAGGVFGVGLAGFTVTPTSFSFNAGIAGSSITDQTVNGQDALGGSNLNGGSLGLIPGDSTGTGTSGVKIYASGGGSSGSGASASSLIATFGKTTLTLVDTASTTYDLVLGTSKGTTIGTATTQKVAFHGSTPVVQRAGSAQAAVATTSATNSSPYGYTTQAQADAIVTLLNEIRAALVEKGLIKGSA